ncbi:MAG: Smr/MutS family protein [Alphaproteobacteria bacterium]
MAKRPKPPEAAGDGDSRDSGGGELFRRTMGDARPLARRKPLHQGGHQDGQEEPSTKAAPPAAAKARVKARAVPAAPPPPPPAPPRAAPAGQMLDKRPTPGLDRRTAERLRRGMMAVEGRLDLHGLSAVRAETALSHFIERAWLDGKRCVLVITGKGRGADGQAGSGGSGRRIAVNPGVLRAGLPIWLRRPPNDERVLSWTLAQPEHGGTGAFYVLLRRQRP